MSQHDFDITTADANTGVTFRAAVNAALQALASSSSGETAPSTTYPFQFFADSASDVLKMRNATNTAWIDVCVMSTGRPSYVPSGVSSTEIGYLDGVTSAIQTQINAKAPIDNPAFTGTVSLSTGTANGVLYLNGSKQVTSGSGLVFDSSGNMLVGTTTQQGGVSARMVLNAPTGSVNGALTTRVDTTSATTHIFFQNPNNTVGSVSTIGSSTTFATSSDYRLKEDYQPVADAIVRLNQLKPVNFAWKVDGSRCDGFLAHELQEVIPEAATGHKDEMRIEEYEITPKVEATFDEEGNELTPAVEAVMGEREVPVYQGIDQSKIVPLLTAALQEAVAKIESLTQRIEALEYKGE